MPMPFDPWQSMTVAADVALASRASSEELAKRTAGRLATLLEAAISRSPIYRHVLQRTRAARRGSPTCRSCARPS